MGSQWFMEDTSLGIGLRYLHEEVADMGANAVSLDAGVLHNFNPALSVGAAVRGLGQEIRAKTVRDQLPLSVILGGRIFLDPLPVRIYSGGIWAPYSVSSGGAGLELGEFAGAFLRGSVEWRETGAKGFAFGVGGRTEMWNIDYTWSSAGAIGGVHRITLLLRFVRGGGS